MSHPKTKQDILDRYNAEFEHVPLKQPVFLNSVPNSGSQLLRNIMRMFVPLKQHFKPGFVQLASLAEDRVAWDKDRPTLTWGHLLYTDNAAISLKDTRKVLMVRDPYGWVIARARFFMSEEFSSSLGEISGSNVTPEQYLNMMIFGIYQKLPNFKEIYEHNAVAWLHTDVTVLKYEDMLHAVKNLDSSEAETFFRKLLDACGVDMPDDWRERARVGSEADKSKMVYEDFANVRIKLPEELPEGQKSLVDFALPGVRKLLGYE